MPLALPVNRTKWSAALASMALLAGCGGGSSDSSGQGPLDFTPTLSARITDQGTYLECGADKPYSFTLERVTTDAPGSSIERSSTITCPVQTTLAGDFALSTWSLVHDGTTVASATSRLPAPVVLDDGVRWVVLGSGYPAQQQQPYDLQALAADDTVLGTFTSPTQVPHGDLPAADEVVRWRWSRTSGSTTFASDAAATRAYAMTDLGYWGAVTNDLLTVWTSSGSPYDGWGLDLLFQNRDFRDVRVVDLNNDGLPDIVSNVYGNGCMLIGLQQGDGSYQWSTPQHSDGTCLGGNGETLLIADFDGDGLLDIFNPTYQRWDYLKNMGGGHFVEMAREVGLGYTNYSPHAEGAAAVDIDLNGTIDIVVGNLILLNDGTGHFSPGPSPYPPGGIDDEGLSVTDLDNDGFYDIVRQDPSLGPRPFWGQSDRVHFTDGGWIEGGGATFVNSYGLTAGRLSGGQYADLVLAGGLPTGTPPLMCVQPQARTFSCVPGVLGSNPGGWSDLLMIDDMDGSGQPQLVARYGTLHHFESNEAMAKVWRITVLDAQGNANQYGRSVRATCAGDGSLVGLKFVDGGNGYMAQSAYPVEFTSSWCPSINVEVYTSGGTQTYGPFDAGSFEVPPSS